MIASVIEAYIGIDSSRPTLRIHVNARPPIESTNSFDDDNDSIRNERLGDMQRRAWIVDAEDPECECCKEMQGEEELRSQSNHSFSDGTNLCINQTFSNKNELQLLLAEAAVKKSFDFATLRSCTKYLKVKCVSQNFAWMLRARKYECSDRFRIYKYIGKHSCGVEHANSSHRKISIKVIASLCVNMYRDGKGPNVKEIQTVMFNSFRCSPSYWKCWKGGMVAKEMVQGTTENGYSCLSGFAHMRKVIAVDGTHLHGKYEGVLLSDVAQDTENHVYPITFCVVDKENDATWTFFFEKLKEIVVNEPDLCFISDRHKSIANSIMNVYNHAHHGYCMRHLDENSRVNNHYGDNLYLYYNAAKAYSSEEFDNHFVEFKNKCPATAVILEYDIGFEKWSRTHFPGNRYDVMSTNIDESLNAMLIDERKYPVASIFNSIAKRFGELFRERDGNQFIVFGGDVTSYVDLLEKSCSCREYDLIKIPCAHAMDDLRSKHGNESEWCVPEELHNVKIFPPLVNTKRGRKRVKGVGENFKSKISVTSRN
ncbi:uncharacterized protein LOC125823100 [Solanum verrucosum]|uniref:uncharacterized protein LOC125823100 n=1 Tax=Solanum verrucosum TaxID=315347 RepID=UPI0020D01FCB|nr:uncharacterized protein LOC125823100 [Solanum verrucosum]